MKHQHVIFVCTSCAGNHQKKQHCQSGGERLLEQLQTLHQNWSLQAEFSIQSVQCMGVCDRDCAIALVSPSKRTYLFGNLPVDDERLEATATAVVDCASQYQAKSDGSLSYSERPELLKTRVIARIPPMPAMDQALQETDELSH